MDLYNELTVIDDLMHLNEIEEELDLDPELDSTTPFSVLYTQADYLEIEDELADLINVVLEE